MVLKPPPIPRLWSFPSCNRPGRDRALSVQPGDLLAVLSAGAYGMTMASNYNTRPRAAEVMVDGAQVHLVREREQARDLFAGEKLIPA